MPDRAGSSQLHLSGETLVLERRLQARDWQYHLSRLALRGQDDRLRIDLHSVSECHTRHRLDLFHCKGRCGLN